VLLFARRADVATLARALFGRPLLTPPPSAAAPATSARRSARSTVRRLPSSARRCTRSRQMSTLTTFSRPSEVTTVLPSRGNLRLAWRYDSCSYVRQHIRRPQHPEIGRASCRQRGE